MLAPNYFQCEVCEEVFPTDMSEEKEARAELFRNFGEVADEHVSIVCDKCHEAFWEFAAEHFPQLKRVSRENLN